MIQEYTHRSYEQVLYALYNCLSNMGEKKHCRHILEAINCSPTRCPNCELHKDETFHRWNRDFSDEFACECSILCMIEHLEKNYLKKENTS